MEYARGPPPAAEALTTVALQTLQCARMAEENSVTYAVPQGRHFLSTRFGDQTLRAEHS